MNTQVFGDVPQSRLEPSGNAIRFERAIDVLENGFASLVQSRGPLGVSPESVGFLVTHNAKSYQILGRVMAEAAPRLDVVDLKAFDPPAPLTTPAVPVQDFKTELAISLRLKLPAWPFGLNSSHETT